MKYLTTKEYAALYDITRQAVEDRIKRKTLPTVFIKTKTVERRIPVEDTEYEKVKSNVLA